MKECDGCVMVVPAVPCRWRPSVHLCDSASVCVCARRRTALVRYIGARFSNPSILQRSFYCKVWYCQADVASVCADARPPRQDGDVSEDDPCIDFAEADASAGESDDEDDGEEYADDDDDAEVRVISNSRDSCVFRLFTPFLRLIRLMSWT